MEQEGPSKAHRRGIEGASKAHRSTETETETESETESGSCPRAKKHSDVSASADERDRVLTHFCLRFARRSYELTPARKRILDEALAYASADVICEAIDLYRDHPAFEFQRQRRDDGLCEYILRKGARIGVAERLDWIFHKADQELVNETDETNQNP